MFTDLYVAISRFSGILMEVIWKEILLYVFDLRIFLHECSSRRLMINVLIIEEYDGYSSIGTNICLKNNKVDQVLKNSMDIFTWFTMENSLRFDEQKYLTYVYV